MDKLYKEELSIDKMAKAKELYQETGDTRLQNEISKNYNIQLARKIIQIVELIGPIGNQYFKYFDVRHDEGITMAGQLLSGGLKET